MFLRSTERSATSLSTEKSSLSEVSRVTLDEVAAICGKDMMGGEVEREDKEEVNREFVSGTRWLVS